MFDCGQWILPLLLLLSLIGTYCEFAFYFLFIFCSRQFFLFCIPLWRLHFSLTLDTTNCNNNVFRKKKLSYVKKSFCFLTFLTFRRVYLWLMPTIHFQKLFLFVITMCVLATPKICSSFLFCCCFFGFSMLFGHKRKKLFVIINS